MGVDVDLKVSDSFHKSQKSSNSPSSVLWDGHTYDSPTSPYGPVHELGGSWVVRSKANRSAAVWSFRLGGEMTRISERFAVGKREKRQ